YQTIGASSGSSRLITSYVPDRVHRSLRVSRIQPGYACIDLMAQPLMRGASIVTLMPKLSKAHLVQAERMLMYGKVCMALKLRSYSGRGRHQQVGRTEDIGRR